jgi:hypothetical protein
LLPDCGPRAGRPAEIPLKGQDESPLSLDRVWGFFTPDLSGQKDDKDEQRLETTHQGHSHGHPPQPV